MRTSDLMEQGEIKGEIREKRERRDRIKIKK